jgi:alpha-beta hydrolase superfamily lysophospholipase
MIVLPKHDAVMEMEERTKIVTILESRRQAGMPDVAWIVPDCAHLMAKNCAPEEYTRRLEQFLDQALASHATV